MISIHLPRDPGAADLALFWSVLTLALISVGGAVGLGLGVGPFWGAAAAAAACAAGFVGAPGFVKRTYGRWNRLAGIYAEVARRCVLRVMHLTVVWVASWTGSRLPMGPSDPGESGWRVRETLGASRYDGEGAVPVPSAVGTRGWVRRMMHWAFRSGNHWSLALVPFFLLLRSFDAGEPDEPSPADIYTLY